MNPLPRIFTVGHSTLPIDDFIALLVAEGVRSLVDVRAFPASRRHPHFNTDALSAALERAGISYLHMGALGGRRKRQDVPAHDTHWRNASFANYADYATTAPFREALTTLEAGARTTPTAIMCAEALWWRCHRRIIAEEAARDGFAIVHILPRTRNEAAERMPELPGH